MDAFDQEQDEVAYGELVDAASLACLALGVGKHRLAPDLVVWVDEDGSVGFMA